MSETENKIDMLFPGPDKPGYYAVQLSKITDKNLPWEKKRAFINVFSNPQTSHVSPGDYSIQEEGEHFRIVPAEYVREIKTLMEDDAMKAIVAPLLPEWLDERVLKEFIESILKQNKRYLKFAYAMVNGQGEIKPWFFIDGKGGCERYYHFLDVDQIMKKQDSQIPI